MEVMPYHRNFGAPVRNTHARRECFHRSRSWSISRHRFRAALRSSIPLRAGDFPDVYEAGGRVK
jgi:hypothetical protein